MAAALRDPPLVGRVFPFSDAPAALRWMKTGESVGKIVLEVT
jgi:NADPH:quinone reductase-like Zn-dependent oxidoreductase